MGTFDGKIGSDIDSWTNALDLTRAEVRRWANVRRKLPCVRCAITTLGRDCNPERWTIR
ncbi:MAG: hypothetical protein J2P17_20055 [Mycobacterium sp.]|nr:hypothetical protein [Mycobacterium sp.]